MKRRITRPMNFHKRGSNLSYMKILLFYKCCIRKTGESHAVSGRGSSINGMAIYFLGKRQRMAKS